MTESQDKRTHSGASRPWLLVIVGAGLGVGFFLLGYFVGLWRDSMMSTQWVRRSQELSEANQGSQIQAVDEGRSGELEPSDESEDEFFGFDPLALPTTEFVMSQEFSVEHPGVDLAAERDQQVFTVGDGAVIEVGYDEIYGKYIEIQHGSYYQTFYAHLSRVLVEEGEEIHKKDVIGFVGSTGHSSAPHLHFEVRHQGTPLDPAKFFVLK